MFHRLKSLPKAHRYVLGGCSLILLVGGIATVELKKPVEPLRYVLAEVTRGTITVAVTGSGQVSGEAQLDVKPTVSGAVTRVLVTPGQNVEANAPLFEIDNKTALKAIRDAAQSVRDASLSLASSELSLKKLKQPADAVALTQAQHSVDQAQRAVDKILAGPDPVDLRNAETEVATQEEDTRLSSDGLTPQPVRNAYDAAVPTLRTSLQSLQQVLYDADTILGLDNATTNVSIKPVLSVLDTSKLALANNQYGQVKQSTAHLKAKIDALQTSGEDPAKIDAALQEARSSLEAASPFLQAMYDVLLNTITNSSFSQANLDSLRSMIQSDRSTMASRVSTILSQITSLEQSKTSYTAALINLEKARSALDKLRHPDPNDLLSAQERLVETQKSLAKLQKGADPIDVSVSENGIAQRRSSLVSAQNRLADLQEALKDYTVRAPFAGTVARVSVKASDQVSASTALATLLTKEKMAQISVNEVDATKLKVNQKATLTFDALPDLTIAGVVSEVDSLGTATQGVVNYSVKIAFVTQDDRIKPSMSVSASIVTDLRVDALLVPNAAIRRTGGAASVQLATQVPTSTQTTADGIVLTIPPSVQLVEVGLSNDQSTEVISGLNVGDQVVTRTIDPTVVTTKPAANTTAGIRVPGVGGGGGFGGLGGGGAVRVSR